MIGMGGSEASGVGGTSGGVAAGGGSATSRGGAQSASDTCRADLRCDPDCHVCVECLVASDCAGRGAGPFKCDPYMRRCMLVCDEDEECPWFTPVCNKVRRVCVECNSHEDCGPWRCIDNVCAR